MIEYDDDVKFCRWNLDRPGWGQIVTTKRGKFVTPMPMLGRQPVIDLTAAFIVHPIVNAYVGRDHKTIRSDVPNLFGGEGFDRTELDLYDLLTILGIKYSMTVCKCIGLITMYCPEISSVSFRQQSNDLRQMWIAGVTFGQLPLATTCCVCSGLCSLLSCPLCLRTYHSSCSKSVLTKHRHDFFSGFTKPTIDLVEINHWINPEQGRLALCDLCFACVCT